MYWRRVRNNVWSKYSIWAILNMKLYCFGQLFRPCNAFCCPDDCYFAPWTTWTECNVTCGGGSQSRTRALSISPYCESQICHGPLDQERSCNTQCCPGNLESFFDLSRLSWLNAVIQHLISKLGTPWAKEYCIFYIQLIVNSLLGVNGRRVRLHAVILEPKTVIGSFSRKLNAAEKIVREISSKYIAHLSTTKWQGSNNFTICL